MPGVKGRSGRRPETSLTQKQITNLYRGIALDDFDGLHKLITRAGRLMLSGALPSHQYERLVKGVREQRYLQQLGPLKRDVTALREEVARLQGERRSRLESRDIGPPDARGTPRH